MNLRIKHFSVILVLLLTLIFSFGVKSVDAAGTETKLTTHVNATTNVEKSELWQGIELERAAIQSLRLGSIISTDEALVYNWDYNMIKASNTPAIKIASWGMPTQNGYKQGTTAQIAKNYEATNPGYMVVAAINGDFFANTQYTSSNGAKNNPTFDPINTWVADGGLTYKMPTVAHPHHNVIGLNLDRTYTYHVGSIYDANGNPTAWNLSPNAYYTDTNGNYITTISLPNAGENLPTFTETPIFTIGEVKREVKITNSDFSETGVNIVLGGSNINVEGYYVARIYMDRFSRPQDGFQSKYWYGESKTGHVYNYDYTGLFIAGRTLDLEETDVITEVPSKYCYLVTKDEEVANLIVRNTSVTVQYELEGEVWGSVNSTIGTVLPYILKGARTQYVAKADNYLNDAKPKAIVAFTKNNECIFMLVGPGQLSGTVGSMKGPSSIEVAELLERVNAYDAFALDGGGSATIVVREKDGSFKTLNATTDGSDRSIGNALLMIIEKPNLTLKEASTTSAVFYQEKPMAESELLSASVVINGKTYPLVDGEVAVAGLTKNTSYSYYFNYEFRNTQGTYTMKTDTYSFKTASIDVPAPKDFSVLITKEADGTHSIKLTYDMQGTTFVGAELLDGKYSLYSLNALTLENLEDLAIDEADLSQIGLKVTYQYSDKEYTITLNLSDMTFEYDTKPYDDAQEIIDDPTPIDPDDPKPDDPTDPTPTDPDDPKPAANSCSFGLKKVYSLILGMISLSLIGLFIVRKKH